MEESESCTGATGPRLNTDYVNLFENASCGKIIGVYDGNGFILRCVKNEDCIYDFHMEESCISLYKSTNRMMSWSCIWNLPMD